jgi:hypothetical protein
VIATYTALEMVAQRSGDLDTARLASEILMDEQRMLEWLRHEIVKLTDPFIKAELDQFDEASWTDHGEVSMDDVQRALSQAERPQS